MPANGRKKWQILDAFLHSMGIGIDTSHIAGPVRTRSESRTQECETQIKKEFHATKKRLVISGVAIHGLVISAIPAEMTNCVDTYVCTLKICDCLDELLDTLLAVKNWAKFAGLMSKERQN